MEIQIPLTNFQEAWLARAGRPLGMTPAEVLRRALEWYAGLTDEQRQAIEDGTFSHEPSAPPPPLKGA
jgi:hypothetical protein